MTKVNNRFLQFCEGVYKSEAHYTPQQREVLNLPLIPSTRFEIKNAKIWLVRNVTRGPGTARCNSADRSVISSVCVVPVHVARTGERRGVYSLLLWITEGKGPLGRPRRRWEDNIKMDLQEMGCGDMDWNELVQDRDR
jgi:hypothetical protein